MRAHSWIRTAMGHKIHQHDPLGMLEAGVIDIRDIAHSCARQCRFGGHTRDHYSVAQHCTQGSFLVPPEWALKWFMHDAQEAYIQDLTSGLKAGLEEYKRLEHWWVFAITEKFDLWPHPWTSKHGVLASRIAAWEKPDSLLRIAADQDHHDHIRPTDLLMLGREMTDQLPFGEEDASNIQYMDDRRPSDLNVVVPQRASVARLEFLARYTVLTGGTGAVFE